MADWIIFTLKMCTYNTFPLLLTPFMRQRKTTTQERRRARGRSHLKPPRSPGSPSPLVMLRTYFSQNCVVDDWMLVQFSSTRPGLQRSSLRKDLSVTLEMTTQFSSAPHHSPGIGSMELSIYGNDQN